MFITVELDRGYKVTLNIDAIGSFSESGPPHNMYSVTMKNGDRFDLSYNGAEELRKALTSVVYVKGKV